MSKSKLALILGLLLVSIANLQGAAATACVAPDRGDGTVSGPATSCNYVRGDPQDFFQILDGLPLGDKILIDGKIMQFSGIVITPGNPEIEKASAIFDAPMDGTGTLAGFHTAIQIPVTIEIHTDPRTPGALSQSFDTTVSKLQGQIVGDPDFDLLRITAGNDFGMPSPGHTVVTSIGGGNYQIDSFFDIEYRIDFIGHFPSSSVLQGKSGSTLDTIRITSEAISPDTDGDGVPDAIDPAPRDPCNPNPNSPACHNHPVGGNILTIDSTALLLAGLSSSAIWMIPTLAALAGAGLYLKFRKN